MIPLGSRFSSSLQKRLVPPSTILILFLIPVPILSSPSHEGPDPSISLSRRTTNYVLVPRRFSTDLRVNRRSNLSRKVAPSNYQLTDYQVYNITVVRNTKNAVGSYKIGKQNTKNRRTEELLTVVGQQSAVQQSSRRDPLVS